MRAPAYNVTEIEAASFPEPDSRRETKAQSQYPPDLTLSSMKT